VVVETRTFVTHKYCRPRADTVLVDRVAPDELSVLVFVGDVLDTHAVHRIGGATMPLMTDISASMPLAARGKLIVQGAQAALAR
jgi:hypothetical protein